MIVRGLKILGQWMLGVILPIAISFLASILLIPSIGPIFGLCAAVILFTTVAPLRSARRQRSLVVLSHVEQVMRLNQPLSNTLRLWSDSETVNVQHEMLRVAGTLDDGGSLSASLADAARFLPAGATDQLESAERNGRPIHAIEQILAVEQSRRLRDPVHGPLIKTYLLILGSVIPVVVGLIMVFVMPKFEQIFKDFRLRMPPATRLLCATARSDVWWPFALIPGLVFFAACATAMREILSGKRWRFPTFLRSPIDAIRWYTPLIGQLDHDRGLAEVCATIADAIEATRDLPTAIAEADHPHLNRILSSRVSRWGDLVRQGVPLADAARAVRMPALVAGLIGNNRTGDNLLAALRFLQRYYDARFSRIAIVLREAALPMMTIAAALVVCGVALAIFEPLIALSNAAGGYR